MGDVRHPVLELRQYTLHPGRREELIALFDREFVETQEACGMAVVGQFRDLDRPDHFVWLRGFPDMVARARGLAGFYGGPVWKAHSGAANATMIDSDDVLLLRPVEPSHGLPAPEAPRAPVGSAHTPKSALLAVVRLDGPSTVDGGVAFETEPAENTFPALPVRTDAHATVGFRLFPGVDALDAFLGAHPDVTAGAAQVLRLTPTARSLLR
jgi:hypothetical protein